MGDESENNKKNAAYARGGHSEDFEGWSGGAQVGEELWRTVAEIYISAFKLIINRRKGMVKISGRRKARENGRKQICARA